MRVSSNTLGQFMYNAAVHVMYVAVVVAHTDRSKGRSLLDPETGIESPLGGKSCRLNLQ